MNKKIVNYLKKTTDLCFNMISGCKLQSLIKILSRNKIGVLQYFFGDYENTGNRILNPFGFNEPETNCFETCVNYNEI